MQTKQYIGESWKHGILIIGAILVLLPFYMMVSMSLKSQQEIQSISRGATEIRLQVYASNQAASMMYGRLGYTTLSRMMNKKIVKSNREV